MTIHKNNKMWHDGAEKRPTYSCQRCHIPCFGKRCRECHLKMLSDYEHKNDNSRKNRCAKPDYSKCPDCNNFCVVPENFSKCYDCYKKSFHKNIYKAIENFDLYTEGLMSEMYIDESNRILDIENGPAKEIRSYLGFDGKKHSSRRKKFDGSEHKESSEQPTILKNTEIQREIARKRASERERARKSRKTKSRKTDGSKRKRRKRSIRL